MTHAVQHWKNYIAGEWHDAAESLNIHNPATGEVVATMACADFAQVDQAMQAARACVSSRALISQRPAQRAELMHRIAREIHAIVDEAAEVLVMENGKSLNDARAEFLEAARYFEYYGGMADKIEGKSIPLGDDYVDYTVYEPMGISVQIVPWNFPPSIAARSLAPALAAGNAVVIKSPEVSPLAMTYLATSCQRAGLPNGALSMLCGVGAEIGDALVRHPDTNQIVFTGSVPTGQSILRAAAERATPCVMELGGKSAAVVFEDADLEQLMSSVKWGIFFNAGQVCSAMSRMLVHRSIYEEVVDKVTCFAKTLRIGHGSDNPDITPVVSKLQHQNVLAMCEKASAQGARLMTGGQQPSNDQANTNGYFIQPTVFADVTPSMDIFGTEVFGPVLAITPFDNEQDAWQLANATDYGLVAGVFTKDLARSLKATQQLRAGQIFVNEWYAGGIETPFGGIGLSGFGREKGQEAIYSYVQTKNVAIRIT
ncbi:aldehyde dehydrogenase family protein [Leucothrix pacifica]|uniref:Aldehyde dehydrogenase n=1 Tax=Leucothrix pacifica TaxID=1247513 RepID=A0A317C8E1_9GAMM|nr:aldehyde dehydrogenase family protein [Leucothrix pacifica]PWQ92580.1 aldehyde dehydrogenase [Leucothrix pacifica]